MKILLSFLKIYTTKESQHDKTSSIDEGFIRNTCSSSFNMNNGLKKRTKQLDHPFKSMSAFLSTFDCNKGSNKQAENGLAKQNIYHDINYTNSKEYSEEITKLDNSNIYNDNNGNETTTNTNTTKKPKESSLIRQEETGLFIRQIKNLVQQKQKNLHKDTKETNYDDVEFLMAFVSKIKQQNNKCLGNIKLGIISKLGFYKHNKYHIEFLYSHLLKSKLNGMENVSLLQILVSEIEFNNKSMIYCFLSRNYNKVLCLIFETFYKLDITPLFFYNVGLFIEKNDEFDGCKDIERDFFATWKAGRQHFKNWDLDDFKEIYRVLRFYNGVHLPEIFDEAKIHNNARHKLVIIKLYNMVKDKYNQGLVQPYKR